MGSVDIWRGNYCSTDETTCSPAYTTRLLPSFWRVMLFLCVVDGGVQFRPKYMERVASVKEEDASSPAVINTCMRLSSDQLCRKMRQSPSVREKKRFFRLKFHFPCGNSTLTHS